MISSIRSIFLYHKCNLKNCEVSTIDFALRRDSHANIWTRIAINFGETDSQTLCAHVFFFIFIRNITFIRNKDSRDSERKPRV